MHQKTLDLIEYPKIKEKLADYAAFGASADLALSLQPGNDVEEIRERLAFTREARLLLSLNPDLRIGGVRDVRAQAERASRAYVLSIEEIVEIKDTLVAARKLQRPFFSKKGGEINPDEPVRKEDLREDSPENLFPALLYYARQLTPPKGLIDRISQTIGEDNQVMDSASQELSRLRSEIKVAHNRLMTKLQSLISNPDIVPLLQDALITQRGGRYVIPLRANFKNRIPAIIHDQSGTGQTLFVEPIAAVELNNTWQELKLAERDEVRRILAVLSQEIGLVSENIAQIVECVAWIDYALMVAKYAEDLKATEPEVIAFSPKKENDHPGSHIHFMRARHPLLDPQTVVPIDILLEKPHFAIVITGPNTGGKTVTLKTTGLMIAMAQSGLHIPVEDGSQFTVFEDILADIGDEQSIEQSLSTFSGHIKNIVEILDKSSTQTLVLFDELGSGTDPLEGEALAHAILTWLTGNQIPSMVATHYAELKSFAYSTPGVVNAAMSFDLESLSPTYHLRIGLPGRSNALLIAERVGLSKNIIEIARQQINPAEQRTEDILEDIQYQQEQSRAARQAAEQHADKNEQLRAELEQRLEDIEQERAAILRKAQAEADAKLKEVTKEIRDLKKRLKRAVRYAEKASSAALDPEGAAQRAIQETQRQEHLAEKNIEKLEELETTVAEAFNSNEPQTISPSTETPKEQAPRSIQAGDLVFVKSFQKEGTIVSLEGKTVEVQLGAMRMKTKISDVRRIKKRSDTEEIQQENRTPIVSLRGFSDGASPGVELDLRGERAEDAVERLLPYLEKGFLTQMPYVRILHGKGTGKLRDVVRQHLRNSRYVLSWEDATQQEGGSGVTIVKFKKN
ncbi:MAG: Smr/MutS family protein [Anaerolineae bacterium]|jgi:DNA mismatch repair protein MutS2|nr:Smr/MutS family protein [Anaerolineae bacterium]